MPDKSAKEPHTSKKKFRSKKNSEGKSKANSRGCSLIMKMKMPDKSAKEPHTSKGSLITTSLVLQCVTMCCSVLQRVAMCCSVLQCVAV